MDILTDSAVRLALRLALAAMFATAALHKLRDPRRFAETLRNYRTLPEAAAPPAAAALVVGELAVAAALVLPTPVALGATGALSLLAVYSAAVGVNLARGRRDIDCGCLGPGHRQPLSEWLLLRNGMAAVAAAALLLPETARPLGWIDTLSLAAALASLSLLWVAGNQLLALTSRADGAGRRAHRSAAR